MTHVGIGAQGAPKLHNPPQRVTPPLRTNIFGAIKNADTLHPGHSGMASASQFHCPLLLLPVSAGESGYKWRYPENRNFQLSRITEECPVPPSNQNISQFPFSRCRFYLDRFPWVPAYQGVITFFVIANFTLATFMDPGVIPKGKLR